MTVTTASSRSAKKPTQADAGFNLEMRFSAIMIKSRLASENEGYGFHS
jgi:hypothetical protein